MNAPSQPNVDDGRVVLNAESADAIRGALLVGLAALAELARLGDRFEVAKLCERPLPAECEPLDPAGSPDALAEIAIALRFMHAGSCRHG